MRFYSGFLFAAVVVAATGCQPSAPPETVGATKPGSTPAETTGLKKLGITDTVTGKGEAVEKGDDVWVNYTGKLANKTVFDTNVKADGVPFHVAVGEGGVIQGWDLGLVGMKVGGKRTLAIPYSLGYGDKGQPPKIPPKSDLYFDIELLTLLKQKDANTINATDVKVGTGREVKMGDTVTIDYEASANGSVEESSKDYTKPTVFKIGADQMNVADFDKALIGMRVGGERKISIPPKLTIGLHSEKLSNNVAIFDVKIVSIK